MFARAPVPIVVVASMLRLRAHAFSRQLLRKKATFLCANAKVKRSPLDGGHATVYPMTTTTEK